MSSSWRSIRSARLATAVVSGSIATARRMRLRRVVDERVERAGDPIQYFRRHRGTHVRDGGDPACVVDGKCGERGHEGRPVDETEPLLRLERERFEPGFLQRVGGR